LSLGLVESFWNSHSALQIWYYSFRALFLQSITFTNKYTQ
jgi:hypothetical protein